MEKILKSVRFPTFFAYLSFNSQENGDLKIKNLDIFSVKIREAIVLMNSKFKRFTYL